MAREVMMSNKRLHLILMMILIFQLATAWQTTLASGQAPSPTREVPITVKVVLVGFEDQWVDRDYFVWDYQTPSRRSSLVWNWNNWQQTGVTYNISYDLTLADWDFKEELVRYLRSIGEKRSGENRWFYNWEYSDADEMFVKKFQETEYVVYDAAKVEGWLYEHNGDYGGLPENGSTFIITFLPELPTFSAGQYRSYWDSVYQDEPQVPSGLLPHYYGIEAVDTDLEYSLRYRDFMTGYGGRHRLWFEDLTAGPTWWSQYEDLPLNTVIEDQDIRVSTSFGKQWLTQLLADYTSEMVYNVVLPEFVYDPIYTSKYKLVVNVLDNRTDDEKEALPIQRTINRKTIESAFKDLVPYADVQVDLQFEDTADYPALQKLLKDNRRFLDSYIVKDILMEKLELVDERPVYKYLQENLNSFVPQISRNETELTIPIFAFALSGDAHFAGSWKWYVGDDPERTYQGMAFGDLVMIGASHMDFHWGDQVGQEGKGIGLTQTVIHEAGHMVGLSHPHNYGSIGDFCLTAMSYYTHDYVFGQNDKDALQRIHADKIILQTRSLEEEARARLLDKVSSPNLENKLNQVTDLIRESENLYSNMSYPESLKLILRARSAARSTLEEIDKLEDSLTAAKSELAEARGQSTLYLAAGFAMGVAVGVVVLVILRRRAMRERASAQTPVYTGSSQDTGHL